MTDTLQQIDALVNRVHELGVEVAQLRLAVLSLGSKTLAGGPPGPKGYLAWHNAQLAPTAAGIGGGDVPLGLPSVEQGPAVPTANPTFTATQSGILTLPSPPPSASTSSVAASPSAATGTPSTVAAPK